MALIEDVRRFWEQNSCGEVYAIGNSELNRLRSHENTRYRLEPFIFEFGKFYEGRGRDVLEIGVGMGADHLQWASVKPKRLVGMDLTQRAAEFTINRLRLEGLSSGVVVANAESMPFPDCSFDIIYSWGVLHHTENTEAAISELFRILRPGGTARVMIYHKYSIVGFMLWARYSLMRCDFRSLNTIYANYLESPGTHAYSIKEARALFKRFHVVSMSVELSVGDLLEGAAGQRHKGRLLQFARALWPRQLIRLLGRGLGLFLLVEAAKPLS